MFALEAAADEEVEELVDTAEFDVGFEDYGVVSLEEGVEEFDDGDGGVGLEAVGEVVAFEHACDGHFACEDEGVGERHFVKPVAIAADFGFGGVEDFEGLGEVGLCILVDFLGGECGAGC